MVCRPSTICDATTIGSTPAQGMAPCVWRPLTTMRYVSPAAISPFGRNVIEPGLERRDADVQPEHGVHLRILEHAFLDHHLRAARLARRAFLGRLEDDLHRSRQIGLHAGEHLGGAEQHRHVEVVPAGVHDADLLAVVLAACLRRERAGPVSSVTGSASMSARRRDDRAGLAALEQAPPRPSLRRPSSPRSPARGAGRPGTPTSALRGCRVPGARAGPAARRRPSAGRPPRPCRGVVQRVERGSHRRRRCAGGRPGAGGRRQRRREQNRGGHAAGRCHVVVFSHDQSIVRIANLGRRVLVRDFASVRAR